MHGERQRWLGAECGGSQPTRGPGEHRELSQQGLGQSPSQKRILAYFEGHRTLHFVPI